MAAPAFSTATAQSSGTTTTTCTVTLPTTAANDILILIAVNGGATTTPTLTTGTFTLDTSWALIDSGTWTAGMGGVWWVRCSGNHSGQTQIVSGTTDSVCALVVRITGAITTGTPIDQASVTGTTLGAVAGGALTGVSTTALETLVCYTGAVDDNQAVSAPTMSGNAMSNLSTAASSGGADSGIWYANSSQAVAGATGNFAITNPAGTAQGKRVTSFAVLSVRQVVLQASTAVSSAGTLPITRSEPVPLGSSDGVASATLALASPTGVICRSFNGTTDELVTGIGACDISSSAFTMAFLYKRRRIAAAERPMLLHDSAGTARAYLQFNASNQLSLVISGGTVTNSTVTVTHADEWTICVVSKASGAATPRYHVYKGGAWTHQDGGATSIDLATSLTGGSVKFAKFQTTVWYPGVMGVAGVWNSALSDGDIETLEDNTDSQDWLDLSPVGFWEFDQADVTEDVADLTGNGADETSISGTAADYFGFAGWDYYVPGIPEIPLEAASGVCSATLVVGFPSVVDLDPASAVVSATLVLSAPAGVTLGASSAVASATCVVYIPSVGAVIPLVPASGVASTTFALAAPVLSGDYPQAVLTDGPILYYRFDEPSGFGSTVIDASGNDNHGFTTGNWNHAEPGVLEWDADLGKHNPRILTSGGDASDPNWISGGETIEFTGRIWTPLFPFVNNASRTFEQWYEIDADHPAEHDDIFESESEDQTPQFVINVVTHGAFFFSGGGGAGGVTWTSIPQIDVGQRIHLVLTVVQSGSSFTAELWVNGISRGVKVPGVGGTYDTVHTHQMVWGSVVQDWAAMKGTYDDHAVYDYALSAAQIREHYTLGSGQFLLGAASGQSSATLALTAPPRVVLGTAAGVLSATLALTAPTKVVLGPAASLSSATLALTASTRVVLGTAAGLPSGTLALTTATRVVLGTSTAVSSVTLALSAATRVVLVTASGVSSATLALRVPAIVVLGPATGASSATLTVFAPGGGLVPCNPASALASATLTLTAIPRLTLSATGISTATLLLTAQTRVVLGTASAVSSATLTVYIPTAEAVIPLAPASAQSSATIVFKVPTGVPLASAFVVASAVLSLTAQTTVVLAAASAQASATLAVGIYFPAPDTFVPLGAVELNADTSGAEAVEASLGGQEQNAVATGGMDSGTARRAGVAVESERSAQVIERVTGGVELGLLGAIELNVPRGAVPLSEEVTGGAAGNLRGVVEMNDQTSGGEAEEMVLAGIDDGSRSGVDDETMTGGDDNP